MAPSSQNLGLLPILALAADCSRSSIAPAYHYSHFYTSDVDEPLFRDVPDAVRTNSEEAPGTDP